MQLSRVKWRFDSTARTLQGAALQSRVTLGDPQFAVAVLGGDEPLLIRRCGIIDPMTGDLLPVELDCPFDFDRHILFLSKFRHFAHESDCPGFLRVSFSSIPFISAPPEDCPCLDFSGSVRRFCHKGRGPVSGWPKSSLPLSQIGRDQCTVFFPFAFGFSLDFWKACRFESLVKPSCSHGPSRK